MKIDRMGWLALALAAALPAASSAQTSPGSTPDTGSGSDPAVSPASPTPAGSGAGGSRGDPATSPTDESLPRGAATGTGAVGGPNDPRSEMDRTADSVHEDGDARDAVGDARDAAGDTRADEDKPRRRWWQFWRWGERDPRDTERRGGSPTAPSGADTRSEGGPSSPNTTPAGTESGSQR